jgi:hypothetical protein
LRMKNSHILTLVLSLALLLAACSGDGESPSVASLETDSESVQDTGASDGDTSADSEEAMLAFVQCLRDQGVDIADPTLDANGNLQLAPIEFTVETDDPDEAALELEMAQFNELMAPCEEILSGLVATGSSQDATEFEDALLEYAQCMRTNGVDMPDPDFSSGGGLVDLGSHDGTSEAFAAADEECREILSLLGSVELGDGVAGS